MTSQKHALDPQSTTQNELETHLTIDYASNTFDLETNLKKVATKMAARLPQYYTSDGTTGWLTDVPLALLPKLPMGCLR